MPAEVPRSLLTAHAAHFGFQHNEALCARYIDTLCDLTRRSPAELLSESTAFFRSGDIGQYARYFMLPEERLLYVLPLLRHALRNPESVLMFVARGAEPFERAWHVWKRILGHRYRFAESFALKVCRGYRNDTDPDAEPQCFLSRSIISALSDHERAGLISDEAWKDVKRSIDSAGITRELDTYLSSQWDIVGGLHGLVAMNLSLQEAVTYLADFGIDISYRRLVCRSRRAHFGTEIITSLIESDSFTVSELVDRVRLANAGRLQGMFDEGGIVDMEAGLVRLADGRGFLPKQCRELVSSIMRIYLNARLLKSLRHKAEHKARPLLNILLRDTGVADILGGSSGYGNTVVSVDEATVSGTSLIAAELVALSFNSSLRHVSFNMAQRTPSASAFLTSEGIVDECATSGIWVQEDMSHFYSGFYDGEMRYKTFEALVRELEHAQDEVNPNRDACLNLLQELDERIKPIVAALAANVRYRDSIGIAQRRFSLDFLRSHIVKLHLRRDDPFACDCQKMLLDDDLLQIVTPFQCDFTGWFFLREMRDKALSWLDKRKGKEMAELCALQALDRQVRFVDLARYFERTTRRYEADQKDLEQAGGNFVPQLGGPLTAFLSGQITFAELRGEFYGHYRP